MGSRPWKEAYLNRLVDRYSGKQVEVYTRGPVYDRSGALAVDGFEQRGDCKRVVGTYTGDSTSGNRQHRYLTVNTAPLGMGPRDDGYFDYDRDILLIGERTPRQYDIADKVAEGIERGVRNAIEAGVIEVREENGDGTG